MSRANEAHSASRIAVIGLSGRFPGCGMGGSEPGRSTIDRFWQNLRDGVESVRSFSPQELAASGVEPSVYRDPRYVPAAAALDDVESFDSAFFDMSPREADVMDPQHRFLLECAWEALENAGYDPRRLPGATGVFAGSGSNTYALSRLVEGLGDGLGSFLAAVGNERDYLTTRLSYKLDLRGPSLTVQTACSTSLVAVHLACQSLLAGECDMALAGGVAITVPHRVGYLHEAGSILSPDGRCRPFDARANGTVTGSGAGIVVLKRLLEALADGDRIEAVIAGSAINNDGAAKLGYSAPSVSGQEAVIGEALDVTGFSPATLGYVEAHGTATPLGDPVEVDALTRAFRAGTCERGFCALGSVKGNVGHLDAAAGVTGLIKTVLALRHGEIPPSLHFSQPNPEIDFAASPFYVNTELRPWPRLEAPRRGGVSSFGIGGTNAHVLVEEAPATARPEPDLRPQLLLLSAQTASALEAAANHLATYLAGARDPAELADVAYTLQVGRARFEHRLALVAKSLEDAVIALRQREPELDRQGPATEEEELDRLGEMGRSWLAGEGVDFEPRPGRRRLELPTYPFERQRHWIEPSLGRRDQGPSPPPAAQANDAGKARDAFSAVAEIWREVLGVDRVEAQDDFFELGGDSLVATQVLSRLRRTLGVELTLDDLFETSTAADLALCLEERRGGDLRHDAETIHPSSLDLEVEEGRL